MPTIGSTELGRRLGVSDSAIRDWSKRYSSHLTRAGAGIVEGANRTFGAKDQQVLATVAYLRSQGVPHDNIAAQLEEGMRVDPPDSADDPPPGEVAALVPVGQLNRALDRVQDLTKQYDELQAELEAERHRREADREEYTERIIELERELGRVEGELKVLREIKPRGLFRR